MSSFIRYKDMAWAQNVEMSHVTLTTPTWRTVGPSHREANSSRFKLGSRVQLVYRI